MNQFNKKRYPWWLYLAGFLVLVVDSVILIKPVKSISSIPVTGYIILIGLPLVTLAMGVREFIRQKAQFSIRSLLLLTLFLAILCSIYKCFGLNIVYIVSMISMIGLACYAEGIKR